MNQQQEMPETKRISPPKLLAGGTNEAFLEYGATEVVVTYGRNSTGEIVIQQINKQDGVSTTDQIPSQPFPKYLKNPTTYTFIEVSEPIEGETLAQFFDNVLIEGNADIREVTAATKLLMMAHPDTFEGVKSADNILDVYGKYFRSMIQVLTEYAKDPRVSELMNEIIGIYKRNGEIGILTSVREIQGITPKYSHQIESDPWMVIDESGVYNGGPEVLAFTHAGNLDNGYGINLTKVKAGLNLEYTPASGNVELILTGGGLLKFSDETRHARIFRGKDGQIDEALKNEIMTFYDYLLVAMRFLHRGDAIFLSDLQDIADIICTGAIEVIQETGKSIIPVKLPEITERNRARIAELIEGWAPITLKPNPDKTTVTTTIISPRLTKKPVINSDNTADEVLEPYPAYINLQELLILIDQGIIVDQRLIAAIGIFLAKEIYQLK